MRRFFGFFKLPLQIGFGAYFAALLFIGTAIGIDHLDDEEEFKWCGDLQMEIALKPEAKAQKFKGLEI